MKFLGMTAVASLAFSLALVPAAAVAAEEGLEVLTDTPAGEAYLEKFEERIEELPGLAPDTSDYAVVSNVPGDIDGAIWILPDGSTLPKVVFTESDGSFEVTFSVESSPEEQIGLARGGSLDGGVGSRAGTLSWNAPTCFARYTTTYGWFDRCTQWGKVVNDGDSARDHWVFKYYGTCKSNAIYYVQSCGLSSTRSSSSSTLYWEDWAPRGDSTGPCRSVSIGVSVFGISASGSYEACDTVDMTKFTAPGSFSNTFRTPRVLNSERGVEYQISLGVPQGGTPRLTTNASMTGYSSIPG